jgi:hypothetical protein
MEERDLIFHTRDNLYVANWYQQGGVETTLIENERLYCKDEVLCTKEAYNIIKNSSYPSTTETAHVLKDGGLSTGRPVTMKSGEGVKHVYRCDARGW